MSALGTNYTTTHNEHLSGPFPPTFDHGSQPHLLGSSAEPAYINCTSCPNPCLPSEIECRYCGALTEQQFLSATTEYNNISFSSQPLDTYQPGGLPDDGNRNVDDGLQGWSQVNIARSFSTGPLDLGSPHRPNYGNIASRNRWSESMQSGVSFDTIGTQATDAAQPIKKKAAKQAAPLPGWEGENPRCQMCPKKKAFKATVFNQGEFCNKHTRKNIKELEASKGRPVEWTNDQGATTTELAMAMVYPLVPPLEYAGDGEDDWVFYTEQAHQNAVVKGFIDATNTRYTGEMGLHAMDDEQEQRVHENFLKQQNDYDHKPLEEASIRLYTEAWIIARMRLLFLVVLTYHRGGTSIYPVGGANNGYGEDKTLTMTRRIAEITRILTRDKRVVMDVIEGRGVAALAANPGKFEERKTSNFKCNAKKKRKLQVSVGQSTGEEFQSVEATATSSPHFSPDTEAEMTGTPRLKSQERKPDPGLKRRKTQQVVPQPLALERDVDEHELGSLPSFPESWVTPYTASGVPVVSPDLLDQENSLAGYNPVLTGYPLHNQPFPGTVFERKEDYSEQHTSFDPEPEFASNDFFQEFTNPEYHDENLDPGMFTS